MASLPSPPTALPAHRMAVYRMASATAAVAAAALGLTGIAAIAAIAAIAPAAGAATGHSAAVAQAKKGLLRLSDFPTGWTSSPSTSTDQKNEVGAREIATCIGVPVKTLVANPPQATSPQFDQTTKNLSVTEQVAVLPTAAASRADTAALANPKAPGCLTAYLAKALATTTSSSSVSTGALTVARLPFPRYGTASTAVTLTLPVEGSGVSITTVVDVVVVSQGKEQATVTLTSLNGGFPTALAKQLVATAARRIG